MDLFDVRNKIRDLLEQGQFESEGGGISLVEPVADLEMTYAGRRYWITIRDTGALQEKSLDPEDTPIAEPFAPEDIPFQD